MAVLNYISPIDQLPLNVFKNLVYTLKYTILDWISKSLDGDIIYKSLKYAIIKPLNVKKTSQQTVRAA